MMRIKKLNKKGFTMVELLAVIVILGILAIISVAAVQGIIAKAKERYYKSQEENFVMATQSYLNSNKTKQPKVSGQTVKVYLKDLRNAKYIDKIVDYKKEPCNIDNSYVQVFKYEDNVYYTPYITCPNYTTDLNSYTSDIVISTEFTGDDKNLNKAGVKITIEDKDPKDSSGTAASVAHGIISYQYKVYQDGKLKYTSDVFDAKKLSNVNKTVALTSYTPGVIKIAVTATNLYGNSKTKTFTKSYKDETAPTCGAVTGDSTTWKTGTRMVTVACNDGNGSGCKSDTFTYEFTGDVKEGKIKIEDKSGNTTICPVNVYIDNNPPVLELKVYKKKAGADEPADDKVIQTIKTSATNQTVELTVDKDSVNGWLNADKYPNGVYLEVNYDDISSTNEIEWKWNEPKIATKSINKLSRLSLLKSIKRITPVAKKGNTKSSLVDEGFREGEVTAKDQFGHVATIEVNIPMDRTPPTYLKIGDSTAWTKNDRTVTVTCFDGISGCTSSPGAIVYNKTQKTQNYTLKDKAGNTTSFNANIYVDKSAPICGRIDGQSTSWLKGDRNISVGCSDAESGCSSSSFSNKFTQTAKTGNITISDKVGNTRNCPVNVYIDKEAPICGNANGASTTWTKNNRDISVACTDSHSGCTSNSFKNTFSTTIQKGKITIKDKVGNTRDCEVNAYVDKNAPTCGSIDGQSTSWTRGDRNITVHCNDTGGGCSAVTKKYTSTKRTDSVQIKDAAGNTNSCNVNVYVDKTAPSCGGVSGGSTSWKRGDRTVSVGCSDSDSGCGQGSYSRYFNWTLRNDNITIYDNAGNSRNCGVNVYLDNTAPSVWTSYGPNGESCGGYKGVKTVYQVRDYDSGIGYVGDWWGDDANSFDPGYALNRHVSGVTEFEKSHHWSARCTSVNKPGSGCYRIKVFAKDNVGNETRFISPGCAKKA